MSKAKAKSKTIDVDFDESIAHPKSHQKVSPAELAKLKKEVYAQNRRLLLICLGLLVFAVAIFFAASNIANWLTPTPWSYDGAVEQVLDGKENAQQYSYNTIVFAQHPDTKLWVFQGMAGNRTFEITTHYGPKELEDIKYPVDANNRIIPKKGIIFTLNASLFDVASGMASAGIAAGEVGKIIGTKNGILNKPTMSTVTGPLPDYQNVTFPATCANSSSTIGVIQFQVGAETRIIGATPNCLIVQGTNASEIIRASDKLLYVILGIMRPANAQEVN